MSAIRKPNFLSEEEYAPLHSRIQSCHRCGQTDVRWLSFESHGATFRPICWSCQQPDYDPNEDNFFLHEQDIRSYRIGQRAETMGPVINREFRKYFRLPPSQQAGHLGALVKTMGTGKTFDPVIHAYSQNQVWAEEYGPTFPMIRRVLILTIQESIRDQIALSLGGSESKVSDLVKSGITKSPPRVLTVRGRDDLVSPKILRCEIAVACIHNLMATETDGEKRLREDFSEAVAHFQVIYYDEFHWAWEQIQRIALGATKQISIGGTATPFDRQGKMLKGNIFVIGSFSYRKAASQDKCLKFIGKPGTLTWASVFEEVETSEAHCHTRGRIEIRDNSRDPDFARNLLPVLNVARKVIQNMSDADRQVDIWRSGKGDPKPHASRLRQTVVPDIYYNKFGLIQVENIEIAKRLFDILTEDLDSHRDLFPEAKGWGVELFHSGNEKNKPRPVRPNSAWLSGADDYTLKPGAKRLGIVVGLIKEGVHQPLCGVIGIATNNKSQINYSQRILGRQIRTPHYRDDQGVLHVPPDLLDQVVVISHEAFENRDAVETAVNLTWNLDEKIAEMPTIRDLIEGKGTRRTDDDADIDSTLWPSQKLAIAHYIGEKLMSGEEVSLDCIAKLFGGDSPKRRGRAAEWGASVLETPNVAVKSLGFHPGPEVRSYMTVTKEKADTPDTPETLKVFLERHPDEAMKSLAPRVLTDSGIRLMSSHLKEADRAKYSLRRVPIPYCTLADIKNELVRDVSRLFEDPSPGGPVCDVKDRFDNIPYALAYTAMSMALGAPRGRKVLENGGVYDTHHFHTILYQPDCWREMKGYIHYRMIESGRIPALNEVFGIPTRAWTDPKRKVLATGSHR